MMKTDISKAQLEVWDWKEKAFERLRDVPENERIAQIKKSVKSAKKLIAKRREQNKLSAK